MPRRLLSLLLAVALLAQVPPPAPAAMRFGPFTDGVSPYESQAVPAPALLEHRLISPRSRTAAPGAFVARRALSVAVRIAVAGAATFSLWSSWRQGTPVDAPSAAFLIALFGSPTGENEPPSANLREYFWKKLDDMELHYRRDAAVRSKIRTVRTRDESFSDSDWTLLNLFPSIRDAISALTISARDKDILARLAHLEAELAHAKTLLRVLAPLMSDEYFGSLKFLAGSKPTGDPVKERLWGAGREVWDQWREAALKRSPNSAELRDRLLRFSMEVLRFHDRFSEFGAFWWSQDTLGPSGAKDAELLRRARRQIAKIARLSGEEQILFLPPDSPLWWLANPGASFAPSHAILSFGRGAKSFYLVNWDSGDFLDGLLAMVGAVARNGTKPPATDLGRALVNGSDINVELDLLEKLRGTAVGGALADHLLEVFQDVPAHHEGSMDFRQMAWAVLNSHEPHEADRQLVWSLRRRIRRDAKPWDPLELMWVAFRAGNFEQLRLQVGTSTFDALESLLRPDPRRRFSKAPERDRGILLALAEPLLILPEVPINGPLGGRLKVFSESLTEAFLRPLMLELKAPLGDAVLDPRLLQEILGTLATIGRWYFAGEPTRSEMEARLESYAREVVGRHHPENGFAVPALLPLLLGASLSALFLPTWVGIATGSALTVAALWPRRRRAASLPIMQAA